MVNRCDALRAIACREDRRSTRRSAKNVCESDVVSRHSEGLLAAGQQRGARLDCPGVRASTRRRTRSGTEVLPGRYLGLLRQKRARGAATPRRYWSELLRNVGFGV